jgi:tetratricopeptide (TPR) repeat protein
MEKSSRRRLQFTMFAILICAVFCVGPMLRDLAGRNYADPKELAAQESNRQGLEAMKQRSWALAITYFDEAIRSYEEVIDEVAEQTALRGRFADLRVRHEALMKSLDGLKTIHDFKTEITDIQLNRGIAFKELGEYQKAIDDFSEVIQWQSLPKAYQLRAEIYRALGKDNFADKDEEMAANFRTNRSESNNDRLHLLPPSP